MTIKKFKQTEIGKIPEDLAVVELKEVAEVIDCLHSKKPEKQLNGFVYLEVFNLNPESASIKMENLTYISKKDYLFWIKRTKPEWGDLVITNTGIVATAMIPKDFNCCIGRNMTLIKPNRKLINPEFLKFYSLSRLFKNEMKKFSLSGTILESLHVKFIGNLKILLPPLPEQLAIASILSSLDSKIELNNKMNKTLEEIGQALFKKWFDDNPEKEKWEEKNIQEFLEFEKGVEPGSKCYESERNKNNIRFIRVGDINSPERSNTYIPLSLTKGKLCQEEDILLSLDATLGIVRIGLVGAHSGGVRKVYSKDKKISKGIIYFLLKSEEVQEIIRTYAQGTTILHAGDSLNHIDILIPTDDIFKKLNSQFDFIFDILINNLKQNQTLSSIRNALLPKLMSGEIRVK